MPWFSKPSFVDWRTTSTMSSPKADLVWTPQRLPKANIVHAIIPPLPFSPPHKTGTVSFEENRRTCWRECSWEEEVQQLNRQQRIPVPNANGWANSKWDIRATGGPTTMCSFFVISKNNGLPWLILLFLFTFWIFTHTVLFPLHHTFTSLWFNF